MLLIIPLVINFSCAFQSIQKSVDYVDFNSYCAYPINENIQRIDSREQSKNSEIFSNNETAHQLHVNFLEKYEFNVAILYDSSYQAYHKWEKRITKSIDALNKTYSKFDIVFNILSMAQFEISDSNRIHPKTFNDISLQRVSNNGRNADFVIFFTGKNFVYFSGKALQKKGVMIICTMDKNYEREIVIHEMGHLFGLPHAINYKNNNYMRMITTESKARSIIPENVSIIKMFRERNTSNDSLSIELIKKRLPFLLAIHERYETDHIILQIIGKSYNQLSDYDSALFYFLKEKDYLDNLNCTRKDSIIDFYEECYRNIGLSYFKRDSSKLSVDFFKDRLNISPDDTAAFYFIGKIFGEIADLALKDKKDISLHLQYWQESKNALQLANQEDSQIADLHFLYGLASYNLGYLSEAINAYKKSISLRNDFVESFYNLGLIYFENDSLYAAIKTFNDVIDIKSDFIEAYLGLGNAYYELTLWEEAKAAYMKVVRNKPESAKAHFNLGLTYLYIGDKQSAFEQCEILKTLDLILAAKLCNNLDKSEK